MSADIRELNIITQKNSEDVKALTKTLDSLVKTLANSTNGPNPDQVFSKHVNVRNGENVMGSRGYSFMKMVGVLTGAVDKSEAKVELDFHNRLHNCFVKELGAGGYTYGGGGHDGVHRFLAPLSTSFMQDKIVPGDFRKEMRACVRAGMDGADHEEMAWIRKKQLSAAGYGAKTLSWLNELTGGALVAPPEMGELIELLRNKEALVNAGARVVPLPPQGRMKYPRQTTPSNTYWVGENSPIPPSDIGTGEVTLQAKKLAVLIKAPNELIRFASPAAEALMRDDMTKSLALGLDLAGLEGNGGDTQPLGIINRQNITRITSSNPQPNGDALVGQDFYRFVAAVEEANADFEGYIMRPKTLYKAYQLRADAVAQGDGAGPFLFNLIREAGDEAVPTIAGYPVTKSTQISQVRSKGSSNNLTYIVAGMWSDYLIGMFGAIEFAATSLGDQSFAADQTWIRGILNADCSPRHEQSFVLMDQIDLTL